MTQHENLCFVDVPEGEKVGVQVKGDVMFAWVGPAMFADPVYLPPGTWRFIALHSQMTEEQAREVVEWYGKGDGSINGDGIGDIFTCYDETEFCYPTAIESYYSLYRHLGLKGEQAILKKM